MDVVYCWCNLFFLCSSRRRHTRCSLVTGVQTCALPICKASKDIARELGLSPNYVDTCLKQAAVKLNVKGRYLAAKILADAERLPEKDTVTSAPTNLVLQTPGLPSPSGFGDKRASAGKGNGLDDLGQRQPHRSEEHTSELPSLMRTSYAVFCLKKKNNNRQQNYTTSHS